MKVAVVGAGFSGLIASIYMLRAGAGVVIYEEHLRTGYPPHCTGLVSEWVIEHIGEPAKRSTLAWYKKLTLKAGNASTELEPRGGVYKLDRVRLEEEMLGEAIRLGAEVRLGEKVSYVTPRGVVVAGSRETYDLVVLAEGLHGRLARSLGIGPRPRHVTGLNAHYTRGPRLDGIVVDFTSGLHEDLFAWLLEVDGVTLAGTGGTPGKAKDLLARVEERYRLRGRTAVYGGPVVLGPPVRRPWQGKVVATGDTAGLNKPLTGGGLYPSTLVAVGAYRLHAQGVGLLEAWRSSLSRATAMLSRQYRVAEALRRDPRLLEGVIEALASSGLARALAGRVDYDRHERLPLLVALRPWKGLRFLASVTRYSPRGVARALLRLLASG